MTIGRSAALIIIGVIGLGISIGLLIWRRRNQMSAEVTEQRHYIEPRP